MVVSNDWFRNKNHFVYEKMLKRLCALQIKMCLHVYGLQFMVSITENLFAYSRTLQSKKTKPKHS